jgi:hypothetical protein
MKPPFWFASHTINPVSAFSRYLIGHRLEEFYLQGYNAVEDQLKSRRNMFRFEQECNWQSCYLLQTGFLPLPMMGTTMFLPNVGWPSTDYMALYPRDITHLTTAEEASNPSEHHFVTGCNESFVNLQEAVKLYGLKPFFNLPISGQESVGCQHERRLGGLSEGRKGPVEVPTQVPTKSVISWDVMASSPVNGQPIFRRKISPPPSGQNDKEAGGKHSFR